MPSAAIFLFACTSAGAEPAFNCPYAKLPAEIFLCEDETLGTRDRDMSSLYFNTYNAAPRYLARILAAEQRAWLRRRNS